MNGGGLSRRGHDAAQRPGLAGRASRLTIRGRLTLVYGGLFLVAGVLLLGVTYALVAARLPDGGGLTVTSRTLPGATPRPSGSPQPQPVVHQEVVDGPTQLSQVAADTREDALDALLTQGGMALAVVGAAAVAFGWLIAGRLLQPLHQVTETARRIAEAPAADRGLHERIALAGPPDEVKELADTFDTMLERLDHAFDSQRRFIGNVSHELRTPLTLNRTLLEVAGESPGASPELRQLGATLLAVNARHERLIDGLLLLARSERELTERHYVDLADIVAHVVAQLPVSPVAVHAEPAEAATRGNAVLLERLTQNLVENGVRHNVGESGWVRVDCGTSPDGWVRLRVSNTGPAVPRYELPHLFEPFHRLGVEASPADRAGAGAGGAGPLDRGLRCAAPAGGPGAGLGLSIVAAIARAHGGQVRAEARDGGGLVVTVTLPAAS